MCQKIQNRMEKSVLCRNHLDRLKRKCYDANRMVFQLNFAAYTETTGEMHCAAIFSEQ